MSLDRDKLIKILMLSTSDSDGEALACLRKATAMMKAAKISWQELLEGGGGNGGSREVNRLKDLVRITEEKFNLMRRAKERYRSRCDDLEREIIELRTVQDRARNKPQASKRDHLDPFASSPYRGRR